MDLEGFVKVENSNFGIPLMEKVASSSITYFDEEGKVCNKKNATSCIIVAYDEKGNRINETWGLCNQGKKESKTK